MTASGSLARAGARAGIVTTVALILLVLLAVQSGMTFDYHQKDVSIEAGSAYATREFVLSTDDSILIGGYGTNMDAPISAHATGQEDGEWHRQSPKLALFLLSTPLAELQISDVDNLTGTELEDALLAESSATRVHISDSDGSMIKRLKNFDIREVVFILLEDSNQTVEIEYGFGELGTARAAALASVAAIFGILMAITVMLLMASVFALVVETFASALRRREGRHQVEMRTARAQAARAGPAYLQSMPPPTMRATAAPAAPTALRTPVDTQQPIAAPPGVIGVGTTSGQPEDGFRGVIKRASPAEITLASISGSLFLLGVLIPPALGGLLIPSVILMGLAFALYHDRSTRREKILTQLRTYGGSLELNQLATLSNLDVQRVVGLIADINLYHEATIVIHENWVRLVVPTAVVPFAGAAGPVSPGSTEQKPVDQATSPQMEGEPIPEPRQTEMATRVDPVVPATEDEDYSERFFRGNF